MKSLHAYHSTHHFAVLSISYEKANAEVRGRFSFFEKYTKHFVQKIHEKNLGDAFVVSTCNRTEIYTTTEDYHSVAASYCSIVGVELEDFISYANILTGEEALLHLFRVASGLESQILGDFEIIGQIKKAFTRFKKEKKYPNLYLERAINTAIQVSKKIKNQTGISNGATSVSYAAVQYVLQQFQDARNKSILLIGTGEIGQNTIENFVKHIPAQSISITNRTAENAKKISEKFRVNTLPFEKIQENILEYDIVIVATGASQPIIHSDWYIRESLTPMKELYCILDLSIPCNVEKSIGQIPGISLVDIDSLSLTIQNTLNNRKNEIPKAEELISEAMDKFFDWEKNRKMVPSIWEFKQNLKQIEANELHKIHKKFQYADILDMELSEKLIQKITNRFAKFIIEHPDKEQEIATLFRDILVLTPPKISKKDA